MMEKINLVSRNSVDFIELVGEKMLEIEEYKDAKTGFIPENVDVWKIT